MKLDRLFIGNIYTLNKRGLYMGLHHFLYLDQIHFTIQFLRKELYFIKRQIRRLLTYV